MSARWNGIKRLFRLPTRRSAEQEVDDEIAFHIESRIHDLVRRGINPTDARVIAEREFGSVIDSRHELLETVQRRRARASRVARWESLWDDLRFATRSVLRSPGLSVAVVTLLSLGVGANVAAFAVAQRLFLQSPAGVREPSTVARLYLRSDEGIAPTITTGFEYAAYDAFAAAAPSNLQLAAYTAPDSAFVEFNGGSSPLRVVYATASFFDVLGVKATIGRTFTGDEAQMGGGSPVAILSHSAWKHQFGGDSSILGKDIVVALLHYKIIGIGSEGFSGPDLDRTDVWLPMSTRPVSDIGGHRWYQYWRTGETVRVLARMSSPDDRRRLAAFATNAYRTGERVLVDSDPDTTGTVLAGPLIETLGPSITPSAERLITTRLVGVTILVLLIACANVANLLFLRSLRRRRELAIRLSLGIPRSRLIRQLLFEGALLTLVSASVALAVGTEGGALLRAMILPKTHWASGTMNWQLVAASLVTASIAGCLSALFPAIRASRTDINSAIKSASNRTDGRRSYVRSGLVVAQTTLSLVLIVAAGLFVYSLRAALGTDLGYDADRIITATVSFRDPQGRYIDRFRGTHDDELAAGFAAIAARIADMPAIEAISLSNHSPLGAYAGITMFLADGRPVPRVNQRFGTVLSVDQNFLKVAGMAVVRGRFFTDADNPGTGRVAVVSETAARAYWPGRDPIGQCIILIKRDGNCVEVVGVTRDTHLQKIVESPVATVFIARAQWLSSLGHPRYLIARAKPGHTAEVVDLLRRELRRAMPSAEPPWVRPAGQSLEPELRPWRLGAMLFSIFGVLAVIVATFGIYSVLAYSVGQRMRELGIRAALGARRGQIVQLVLGEGAWPIVAGVVVGLLLSLALGRVIESMLLGTTARNPFILAGAALALIVSGTIGSLLPAWRATRVDPASALRTE